MNAIQRLRFDLTRLALFFFVVLSVVLLGTAKADEPKGKFKSARTPSFTVEPIPSWVTPTALGDAAPMEHASLHYRLIEDQHKIDDKGEIDYQHYVRVVDDNAGLSKASQIEIIFDPNYQTLAFHHIEIVRGNQHINKFDRNKVQLLQRETQLERQIYDGRVTASIIVDDVRVGDQIDVSYTVRGANPVFEGKVVGQDWLLSDRGPAALVLSRWLYPASRTLHVKTWLPGLAVEHKSHGDEEELWVRRSPAPQFHAESGEAAFYAMADTISVSEFADWNDVARWGSALFNEPQTLSPTVDAKASEIASQSADPAQRVLTALQFVQTEIRYFGTELGESSHRPAAPEKVITQRFGDCKDKVLLFMALLRRMDIAATPVLIATPLRSHVGDMLPSPAVFNHVIARVEINGTSYFLDGTREHQTGSLADRQSLGFGQGLVLLASSSAPSNLPSAADFIRAGIRDEFTITDFAKDATLESRITFHGDAAEGMRALLATRPQAEIETLLDTWYVRNYPKIHSAAPMTIEDSTSANQLVLVQHFLVPDFLHAIELKQVGINISQWGLIDGLRIPNEQTRLTGYSMMPGRTTDEVIINLPEDCLPKSEPKQTEESDRYSAYRVTVANRANQVSISAELQVYAEELTPGDWTGHSALVAKVLPKLGSTVSIGLISQDRLARLNADLRQFGADVKAGKLKLSQRQITASSMVLVRTAQLESNRAPVSIRAALLAARAAQHDALAQYAQAQADYDAALSIAPDSSEILDGAATAALSVGNIERALSMVARALVIQPQDRTALELQARASYLQGKYDVASTAYQSLLKDRAVVEHGYALIWLALATKRAGKDVKTALAPYVQSGLSSAWPRPLIDLQLGQTTPEQALAAANNVDPVKAHDQLTEAYFYIGEDHLIAGDQAAARASYQKVLDQNVTDFIEDAMARVRLQQAAAT